MDPWAYHHRVQIHVSLPGKPTENHHARKRTPQTGSFQKSRPNLFIRRACFSAASGTTVAILLSALSESYSWCRLGVLVSAAAAV